eukprot:221709-Alexandrium_andersonii.AAC.1
MHLNTAAPRRPPNQGPEYAWREGSAAPNGTQGPPQTGPDDGASDLRPRPLRARTEDPNLECPERGEERS